MYTTESDLSRKKSTIWVNHGNHILLAILMKLWWLENFKYLLKIIKMLCMEKYNRWTSKIVVRYDSSQFPPHLIAIYDAIYNFTLPAALLLLITDIANRKKMLKNQLKLSISHDDYQSAINNSSTQVNIRYRYEAIFRVGLSKWVNWYETRLRSGRLDDNYTHRERSEIRDLNLEGELAYVVAAGTVEIASSEILISHANDKSHLPMCRYMTCSR